MPDAVLETRRAFGVLFVGVAVAVFAGAVLSEIAFQNDVPIYYYAIIWLGSFGATFGAAWPRFRKSLPSIRGRMKNSVRWSQGAKALNAVCWTVPFASIAVFPALYQYLILLGIGLGNMATYAMMKRYSGLDNREQIIVAAISLAALPAALAIDTTIFAERQDIAVMLSRMLIALAYGAGGAYALFAKS
jgi:hypothetical protein